MSILRAKNVGKFYGSFPALRSLHFTVEAGQCVALLGRNGAGKTTLLKILGGLSRPSEGELENSARISLLGHGIGVYDELSGRQNLEFFAALSPVPVDTEAWLAKVNLAQVADAQIRSIRAACANVWL